MDQRNDSARRPENDRTDSGQFHKDRREAEDVRKANDNIRKAQGDDATGTPSDERDGNRPRFDRDR